MTAQEIINAALRALGELAANQEPTVDEAADALTALNRLLQGWNAEALPIPQVARSEISLTGAASYALSTRPLKIRGASVVVTTDVSLPLLIATPAEWAAYMDKAGQSDFGEILFYEDLYPLGKIYIAPIVTAGTLEVLAERHIGSGVMPTREAFDLTGAAVYTIGAGGDFDSERPSRILGADILAGSTVAKGLEIVTAERWAAYPRRGEGGKFAQVIYCDAGYPTATVRLGPNPGAGSLELYTLDPLTSFDSLTSSVDLPPLGYDRALVYNLALDLASEYGRDPGIVAGPAEQSRNAIANLNASVLGPPLPATGPAAPTPPPTPAGGNQQ